MTVVVKMLTTGPNHNKGIGELLVVDRARGLALVKDGHAEYVRTYPEEAVIKPPIKAILPRRLNK